MGNILYEKQPEVAIKKWEKAIQQNPNFSIAYRNLGWGYNYHYDDISKAISNYEKAIALNKNEGIYYSEIGRLYERNNTPIATRLKLFEEAGIAVVKQRDDASMLFIEYILLAGQSENAVDLLDGMCLGYREGESRARNVRIDANLMLGKQYFTNKDYQKALQYFSNAMIAREEAGNERQGNREAQVNYYIGIANEALHNRSAATTAFRNSVQETARTVNVMNYYQGLSHDKLGNKDQAKKVFESLVSEADRQLQRSEGSEVGIIFGRGEAGNDRLSRLYTMRGLGHKGLGQLQQAKDDLDKAVELSQSNLWATVERVK
jgi:tetratricopeptide (TPR) repeat protein